MTESKESQNKRILNHLKAGGEISSLDGFEKFGCVHVPRRIKDLKESGYEIRDRWAYKLDERGKVEKRWKVWWIA